MSARHPFGVLWAAAIAAIACEEDVQRPPPPPVTYGSAVITWRLQDTAGDPLTCEELSISNASVALGPDRVDVPCGDEQSVRFDMLTPGIYGVTLRLDVLGRGQILSQTDNIRVVAAEEAQLDMVVEIDTGSMQNGSLMFRWTVDGLPASVNCGRLGVETVHIETTPSSIAQFAVDEDCTTGEVLLESIMPGIYSVRAEMRDASGARVGNVQAFGPRVRDGERTEISIAFFVSTQEPAAFHGTWSITSSTASTACANVPADLVEVSLREILAGTPGEEIGTATAACDARSVTIRNLFIPNNPPPVRATFVLFSDFLGRLDTETSTFTLAPGETSTVTVDFDLE